MGVGMTGLLLCPNWLLLLAHAAHLGQFLEQHVRAVPYDLCCWACEQEVVTVGVTLSGLVLPCRSGFYLMFPFGKSVGICACPVFSVNCFLLVYQIGCRHGGLFGWTWIHQFDSDLLIVWSIFIAHLDHGLDHFCTYRSFSFSLWLHARPHFGWPMSVIVHPTQKSVGRVFKNTFPWFSHGFGGGSERPANLWDPNKQLQKLIKAQRTSFKRWAVETTKSCKYFSIIVANRN